MRFRVILPRFVLRNTKSNILFIWGRGCVPWVGNMGCKRRTVFRENLDRGYLNSMPESEYEQAIERLDSMMDSKVNACPFCDSEDIIKKGRSSTGTQRYACKTCGRGFIGNVVPYSHISTDRWKTFCHLYLKGISIHRCATRCGVCLKTAQYMKDRLVRMVRSDAGIPMTFCGEMMIDVAD